MRHGRKKRTLSFLAGAVESPVLTTLPTIGDDDELWLTGVEDSLLLLLDPGSIFISGVLLQIPRDSAQSCTT